MRAASAHGSASHSGWSCSIRSCLEAPNGVPERQSSSTTLSPAHLDHPVERRLRAEVGVSFDRRPLARANRAHYTRFQRVDEVPAQRGTGECGRPIARGLERGARCAGPPDHGAAGRGPLGRFEHRPPGNRRGRRATRGRGAKTVDVRRLTVRSYGDAGRARLRARDPPSRQACGSAPSPGRGVLGAAFGVELSLVRPAPPRRPWIAPQKALRAATTAAW